MRITGGQSRGRILATPKGLEIRPSSDRVREAVFNVLGQDLSGLNVLDLFAGTGSFGIEALSRGAAYVHFIDISAQSISLIKKNLSACGYALTAAISRIDLRRGIPAGVPASGKLFDLVFLDPPYGRELLPPLLEELSESTCLSPQALVVTESSRRENTPSPSGHLAPKDTRFYGDTRITIYEYQAEVLL